MSRGDVTPGGAFLARAGREFGKPVCRLGLASHGSTAITAEDVLYAVSRGVNFLNWSGFAEGPPDDEAFPAAVAALGRDRDRVAVCVQFAARTAAAAARELRSVLAAVRSDYLDVLTLYSVERADEWESLAAPGGVVEYFRTAKEDRVVRRLGETSHQRPLAAMMVASGLLDCVMVRYNAAHRGAERDVFPETAARGLPVIAYTALRWGALLRPTPDDPPGFVPPPAPAWYRFVLQHPAVSVALSAPHTRAELDEDLQVLSVSAPLPADEYESLARHGQRVRRHVRHLARSCLTNRGVPDRSAQRGCVTFYVREDNLGRSPHEVRASSYSSSPVATVEVRRPYDPTLVYRRRVGRCTAVRPPGRPRHSGTIRPSHNR